MDLEPSYFPNDGKIAFRRNGGGAHIWTLEIKEIGDIEELQLTKGAANNIQPAVSPDGKKIAFASDRGGDYDIYVMKAKPESATNRPVKLTRNTVLDWNPDWSPNGTKLVFESAKGGGDREIAVINADGRGLKYLTNNTAADIDPVWSPDGKRIAFERNPGASRDIWRMRADGTNLYNITDDGGVRIDANPSWQPR